jgi:hypothetical protein
VLWSLQADADVDNQYIATESLEKVVRSYKGHIFGMLRIGKGIINMSNPVIYAKAQK